MVELNTETVALALCEEQRENVPLKHLSADELSSQ